MEVSVKEFDKIILPEDRDKFVQLMKEKGVYDDYSMICIVRIQSKYKEGELHPDISGEIKIEKDWKLFLRKREEEEK